MRSLAIIRNEPTGWHIFHGSLFRSTVFIRRVAEDSVEQTHRARIVRHSVGCLHARLPQGCRCGMISLFNSSPGKSCLKRVPARSRALVLV